MDILEAQRLEESTVTGSVFMWFSMCKHTDACTCSTVHTVICARLHKHLLHIVQIIDMKSLLKEHSQNSLEYQTHLDFKGNSGKFVVAVVNQSHSK